MRFDVTLIRIVFIVALASAGFYLKPINGWQLSSAVIGGVLAIAIIFFEARIRKASLKTLIGGAVGSILGIAGATLVSWIISSQHSISEEFKSFLTLALTLMMAYIGLVVGAVKGD